MVVVEEVDQLVEGHIVPQLLRTPGQGGVQGDVPPGPVAVAPLALQGPELQGRSGDPQGGNQGPHPVQGRLQPGGALLPVHRWQGPGLSGPLPLQGPGDPAALVPEEVLRPVQRVPQGDGEGHRPVRPHPQVQILHPPAPQEDGDGAAGGVHQPELLHFLSLLPCSRVPYCSRAGEKKQGGGPTVRRPFGTLFYSSNSSSTWLSPAPYQSGSWINSSQGMSSRLWRVPLPPPPPPANLTPSAQP